MRLAVQGLMVVALVAGCTADQDVDREFATVYPTRDEEAAAQQEMQAAEAEARVLAERAALEPPSIESFSEGLRHLGEYVAVRGVLEDPRGDTSLETDKVVRFKGGDLYFRQARWPAEAIGKRVIVWGRLTLNEARASRFDEKTGDQTSGTNGPALEMVLDLWRIDDESDG
jgi:hypothetical protein